MIFCGDWREGLLEHTKERRKKIVVLAVVLSLGILGVGFSFFFRGIHATPFQGNGRKAAVLFRDFSDGQTYRLEYVGTTQITVEGKIKNPVFRQENFSGIIGVDYFCEQGITGQFATQNACVEEKNGMGRIVVYQHLFGLGGQPLAGFPVELRLFFGEGMANEILKVSWERRGDYVYWLVNGVENEEEAREALEDFLAWPKEDAYDVLFY